MTISSFLQGFRLVTGDALNTLISTINGLIGVSLQVPASSNALLTTNGAIDPHTAMTYVITKAGVLADTLAAPTATADDGKLIVVTSNTANAHTITATGLFQCGTAATDVATFAAQKGAGLTLMAYQGKWCVLASVGITFS